MSTPLVYGSVCSGIEAASVAWHPLGWRAAFLSEIEAFPRAVLTHHYASVPLHGDFTTIGASQYEPISLLVGGTPCQSFSVAGLRGGLADERGNLALEFLRLAHRTRPRWVVWENVPGVLSSNGGRDFGAILGGLVELGYGFAYRVLDAQWFGVAQRRQRVFVVGHLGDWRRAAAVLFERHGLSGHPAPRRETGTDIAGALTARAGKNGGAANGEFEAGRIIPCGLGADGQLARALTARHTATGRLDPNEETFVAQAMAFHHTQDPIHSAERRTALGTTADGMGVLATAGTSTLTANYGKQLDSSDTAKGPPNLIVQAVPRRLTPRECERLQGFPDNYTLVPYRRKPAADGPRYKALGNSFAVSVVRWIGERIQMVDAIALSEEFNDAA